MEPGNRLLCLLLLGFWVAVAVSSASPPKAAQRDFRTRPHPRNVPNPLLSSRQVNPDSLRSGASKRQSCPTPQVSGGCCPAGQTVCGTVCTDTSTDIENCGTCGATCIDGFCAGGMCECGAGSLLCDGACIACPQHSICGLDGQCGCNNAAGYYSCDNACSNYNTDINNCGFCGNVCSSGTCNSGICCPNNEPDVCNSACTDLATDPLNCGQCGQVCGVGEVCSTSSCQTCQSGFEICSNACVSLLDPMNCGSCGNACTGSEFCADHSGRIGCSLCVDGTSQCDGNCVDLTEDPANCGSCGQACGADQICSGSSCQTCISGSQSCSNTCIALADPSNCGSCGNVCGSSATCVLEVLFGTFACVSCAPGASACGLNCVFLGDDPANCGSCGHACGADQICSGSSCSTCAPGLQPCSNVCVSTELPANCGACGAACGTDQICSSVDGYVGCVTCPTGTEVCDNECISLTDSGNCGTCGNACPSGLDCFELSGPGVPTSYACLSPTAQCQGLIQVWNGPYWYGYLYWMGYDYNNYGWASQGTVFSIQCGGGTELDITSLYLLNDLDIYVCAAESDYTPAAYSVVGCAAETDPGSTPTLDDTDYITVFSETAVWSMDPDTFEITVSWVDASGSKPPMYIVDLAENVVCLTLDFDADNAELGNLTPDGSILLTLIFVPQALTPV